MIKTNCHPTKDKFLYTNHIRTKKFKYLRKKEKESEVLVLASTKDLIDQKVNVDIQHVEVAIQLGQEIGDLTLEDS